MLVSPSLPLADYRKSLIAWWVGYLPIMLLIHFEKIQCISMSFQTSLSPFTKQMHLEIPWPSKILKAVVLFFFFLYRKQNLVYSFIFSIRLKSMFLKFWGIQRFACYPLQSTFVMYFALWHSSDIRNVFFKYPVYLSYIISCPVFQTS